MIKQFPTVKIPIDEQIQIVSFLDTKTQKIDELIEKTEQKIKLLKEKRTSLINHCVTKGLNPNVEMKDSGVEWIGEIPSHWINTKIKYVGDYINGFPFKPSQWGEKGRLIIRIQNLTKGNSTENYFDGELEDRYIIKKGDLLF